ncbi:MAG TPA: hypothetical protein VLG76_08245 [Rhabdochlamydiaceae bacterium]|nr:hypothetical protein [Rhabdochlamydiaceae bacterium]
MSVPVINQTALPGVIPGHQGPTAQATTEAPQEAQNDAPSSCAIFLRTLAAFLLAILCTCIVLAPFLAPIFLFP